MKSRTLLVLGSARNKKLTKDLFDAGFAPVVRETMQGALRKLHRQSFAAIVLDRASARVDALEFILNVRDIDDWTPIFVVGKAVARRNYDAILSEHNALVLDEPVTADSLAAALPGVFAGKMSRGA